MKQARLNTLENARKTYNKLFREYIRDEISTEKARTAAYLLNGILQYWRVEKDLEIEARLEAIEAALEDPRR